MEENLKNLEDQVLEGQAALGQLMRQFLAVNDFKHVQFMGMAHAVTGVRWLHSSQISTLKRGGTKNLTGFPLYSVAAVNKAIWEVNNGLREIPKGTRKEDWENKLPMIGPDGDPLDIGDLWRIYFGDMKPPLFSQSHITVDIDKNLAQKICEQYGDAFTTLAEAKGRDQMDTVRQALSVYPATNSDDLRKVKGVLLGVIDLTPDEVIDTIDDYAEMFSELSKRTIAIRDIYECRLKQAIAQDPVPA